jgi:hypothetical protein
MDSHLLRQAAVCKSKDDNNADTERVSKSTLADLAVALLKQKEAEQRTDVTGKNMRHGKKKNNNKKKQ